MPIAGQPSVEKLALVKSKFKNILNIGKTVTCAGDTSSSFFEKPGNTLKR